MQVIIPAADPRVGPSLDEAGYRARMTIPASPARGLAVAAGLLLALAACTSSSDSPEPPGPPSGSAPSPADPLARAALSVVSVEAGGTTASGVVLTADGHILTSQQVSSAPAEGPVTVTLERGDSGPASIVGDDPRTGLAVVKVDGVPDLPPPAVLGDSNQVQPGDEVRVLSGPLVREGQSSSGAVTDTSLTVGSASVFGTDAPVYLGAAGGPVVNLAGEVIGIVTGIRSTSGGDDTSLALPANSASRVADELIAGGPVRHPYLGVQVVDRAAGAGAQVQQVAGDSPAARAGLRPGDVINRVGQRAVSEPDELLAAVQAGQVGEEVPVGFLRDGTEQEVTVTLGQAPAEQ